MKRVFIDSGASSPSSPPKTVSTTTRGPCSHERTRSAGASTTNAVVVETYSLLLVRSRGGRRSALAFLDMVGDDAYHVERVRKRDDERAIALLRAHEDKSYSLCDALR